MVVRETGEVHTEFWWRNLKVKDHLEGLASRGEGNIKTDLQEVVSRSVNWIGVAQDMNKWRALGKAL